MKYRGAGAAANSTNGGSDRPLVATILVGAWVHFLSRINSITAIENKKSETKNIDIRTN